MVLLAASCGTQRSVTTLQTHVDATTGATQMAHHYKVVGVTRSQLLVDSALDAHPDSAAMAFIAPYKREVDSIMSPIVGYAARTMTAHRPESELSNLMADIMVWKGKDFGEKPDFGVYNMGGIRASLLGGKVTIGDVVEIAPFENKICFLTLSGDKVMELFRQIAHRGGEGLSASVRLVITRDGQLKSATLNGKPIDAKASYRIATIDYLAGGTDQMEAFLAKTNLNAPKAKENDSRFIIMDYFREAMKQGRKVDAKIEGRVVVE